METEKKNLLMSLQKSHSSFLVSSKDSREHGSIIMKGHAIFAYENWRNSANKSTKLLRGEEGECDWLEWWGFMEPRKARKARNTQKLAR